MKKTNKELIIWIAVCLFLGIVGVILFIPFSYALEGGSSNSFSVTASDYFLLWNGNRTTTAIANATTGQNVTLTGTAWTNRENKAYALSNGAANKLIFGIEPFSKNVSFMIYFNHTIVATLGTHVILAGYSSTDCTTGEAFLIFIDEAGSEILIRDGIFTVSTSVGKWTANGKNHSIFININNTGTSWSLNYTFYNVTNQTGILNHTESFSQPSHIFGNSVTEIRSICSHTAGDEAGDHDFSIDEIAGWDTTAASVARPTTSVSDTTSPIINGSVLSVNGTILSSTVYHINQRLNFTFNVTDETGLSWGNITINITGKSPLNFTFALSGTTAEFSKTIPLNLTRGAVINITGWVNDTSGNFKQNSTIIVVNNTNATIPNIVNASDKTINGNVSLNWTSTDADGDSLLFTICINGPCFDTRDFNFTTNFTADGIYYLNISASDGVINTSNNTRWNITLDTTTPINVNELPANGTAYNESINITKIFRDLNPFEGNCSVYNVSNGRLLFSNNTINLSPSFSSIDFAINFSINTSWGEGTYNATCWFGDTKNKDKKMPKSVKAGKEKSDKTKSKFNVFVFNDTKTGLQINISVLVKNNKKLEYLEDSQNLEINITLMDNDYFKLVIAYDTTTNNQETVLNFTSNQKVVQVFDDLATHLLFGYGKERLSFDSDDAVKDFSMVVKPGTESYLVEYKPKNNIQKGSRLVIDPRQDNLNILETSSNFEIDFTAPRLLLFNISNNTYTNAHIINITYNITDNLANNHSIVLYVNSNRNESRKWADGVLQNISVNITANGNYTIYFEINDSAGNINSTVPVKTLVIDNVDPLDISPSNRTRLGNLTNIKTTTDVNISVFVGDLNFKNCTFEHNASNSFQNVTTFFNGNNTLSYIIGAGNFTVGKVVGWKYHCYDLAGNYLDPVYTFVAGSPDSAASAAGGGGGGGGGGGTIGAIRQCKEYAQIYKQCYYFDGIGSCKKGCQQGQTCNAQYECVGEIASQTTMQELSESGFLRTPLQRFFGWIKNLLKPSLEKIDNNFLSIDAGTREKTEEVSSQTPYVQAKQKLKEISQKDYKLMPYIIAGSIILFFVLWYFGIFALLWNFVIGFGIGGFVVLLIILIFLAVKFFY